MTEENGELLPRDNEGVYTPVVRVQERPPRDPRFMLGEREPEK